MSNASIGSLAVVGKARLLARVRRDCDGIWQRRREASRVANGFIFKVEFPEGKWPVNDEDERVSVSPVEVARGNYPDGSLIMGESAIPNSKALAMIEDAEEEVNLCDEVMEEEFEDYGKTRNELMQDLHMAIRRLGVDPEEAVELHM